MIEVPDNQVMVSVGEAISAGFSFLTVVAGGLIMFFRSKDKKDNTGKLDRIETEVTTISRQYEGNNSPQQIKVVVSITYQNFEATLSRFLLDYVRAGKPPFTPGQWCLESVFDSGFLRVKDTLDEFKHKGTPSGSYVAKESFKALEDKMRESILTFNDTEGLEKYVEDEVRTLKAEVTDKLL